MLLITHFYITYYFGYDALGSLKMMYIHLFGFFWVSIVNILYQGPRPYWVNDNINSYSCPNEFIHPSIYYYSILFFILYAFVLIRKYIQEKKDNYSRLSAIDESNSELPVVSNSKSIKLKILNVFFIIGNILFFVFFLINYFNGTVFIINLVLSVLISLFYLFFVLITDLQIDELIKKLTILKLEAKRYIFYCLLFLLLCEGFAIIIFRWVDYFLDIQFIHDYVSLNLLI